MDNVVVFITASGEEEAARIAHAILAARIAACVNIVKGMRSMYRWKGKIEDEAEVLMIAKTRGALFERLSEKVKELHSYTVPEVIAIPIISGAEGYLKWLREETD
ncbi:MAG TPA: divalent-cation tolerance protein CutA [Thermodesulfovibrionales bacterium]|nr:divalent-cation tolerance protein CutA [Thermodesulfovibrionales bacterium]